MSYARYETEKVDATPLGQPLEFQFSGKTAKNRFLKAAMSERLSSWDAKDLPKRGIPSKELINAYRRWGEGGYGVILTGNTMLEYDQLEIAGNPIIPYDAPFSGERFEAFREQAAAAKKHGSLIYSQVSHPGRQVTSKIQEHPISASDVRLEIEFPGSKFAKPRAMEKADFERVINGFVHAAEYLYKSGYDGIQLHAAHGYLLAQFLSPTTNKRTDQYGGSLANRMRLILEISDAIRARVPDQSFSIAIKINSVEFQEDGFSPDDAKKLCVVLEQHGFDWVELSGGTYESLAFSHKRESTKKREAFFLEFAELIIPELKKTKVYITGGFHSAAGMVKALETTHGVGLARAACNEFDLPQKILDGKVSAAVESLLDETNFGLTNIAAATQIRIVGHDQEPLDFSREDHTNAFKASLVKSLELAAKDPNYVEAPTIEGVELQSYGTPYAATA